MINNKISTQGVSQYTKYCRHKINMDKILQNMSFKNKHVHKAVLQ